MPFWLAVVALNIMLESCLVGEQWESLWTAKDSVHILLTLLWDCLSTKWPACHSLHEFNVSGWGQCSCTSSIAIFFTQWFKAIFCWGSQFLWYNLFDSLSPPKAWVRLAFAYFLYLICMVFIKRYGFLVTFMLNVLQKAKTSLFQKS